MNTGCMHRLLGICTLTACLCSWSPATYAQSFDPTQSQPAPQSESRSEQELRIQTLVGILDSDDYDQRELATASLTKVPALDRKKLAEILSDDSLSLEQRQRLESIALNLFQREPRAGLGVQFDQNSPTIGAAIGRTIEGFDAANVLKAGDIVVAVDGRRIGSSNDLRFSIISRTAGERLPMVVLRDDVEIEVAPILGAYADLGNGQPMRLQDLMIAWRMWFDRLGVESSSPADQTIDVMANTSSTWVGKPPTPARVTVGGSVREALNYAGVSGVRVFNNNNPNIRVQVFQNGVQIEQGNVLIRDPKRAQIDAINQRTTIVRLQIEVYAQALDRVSPERRAELEAEIVKLKAELEGLEQRRVQLSEP